MDTVSSCHVMIDMETYGLSPRSVFRSIAAVLFSLDYKNAETRVLIDCGVSIEEQLMYGSVLDQSTINFWRDQPAELREVLLKKQQEPLYFVLSSLRDNVLANMGVNSQVYLWSHGSNFDTVILDEAYKGMGLKPFWLYKNVRDTRTLFDLAGYEYIAKGRHDALEDAIVQINAVRESYKILKGIT